MTQHDENPNPPPPGGPDRGNPYAQHAQAAADRARVAAQDALGVARRLLGNPVGGIGPAHAGLSQDRALGVAVVFALVAAIGLALAGGMLMRSLVGAAMGAYGAMPGFGFNFGQFLKAVLVNLITIAAAGGGVLLFAPLLGGRTNPVSALLVSATAYLPLGIAALLAAILGWLFKSQFGAILVGLLMLYGLCYLVLTLNAGLRHVAGVDERRAALGTPTVLAFAMLVMWLVGRLFG